MCSYVYVPSPNNHILFCFLPVALKREFILILVLAMATKGSEDSVTRLSGKSDHFCRHLDTISRTLSYPLALVPQRGFTGVLTVAVHLLTSQI